MVKEEKLCYGHVIKLLLQNTYMQFDQCSFIAQNPLLRTSYITCRETAKVIVTNWTLNTLVA